MTARERIVIRAVIRALRAEDYHMDILALFYGLSGNASRPVKDRAAALLEALVQDDRT